jgi:hypothetical protein
VHDSDSTRLAFTVAKSDKIFSGSSSINLKQKSSALISNSGLLLWTDSADLPLKILLVLAACTLGLGMTIAGVESSGYHMCIHWNHGFFQTFKMSTSN